MKSSPSIFQLRYIDNDGLEKIRVEHLRKNYKIVSNKELQNKKDRYYFRDIFNSKPNTIWYSKIDLNIEHGKVVRPIQPTLRVGTVVLVDGEKKGILIFNIDVKRFFENLKYSSLYNIYLVDKNGDFIIHPNDIYSYGKYLNSSYNISKEIDGISLNKLSKHEFIGKDYYIRKLNFKNSDNISMIIQPKESLIVAQLNKENLNRLYFAVVILIIILLSFYIFIKRRDIELFKKHNGELLEEQQKVQSILDTLQSMVILSDGKSIKECNKRFLDFFNINGIEQFIKTNKCVCEYFENEPGYEYLQENMDGQNWADYVYCHKEKVHKVKITDFSGKVHFFIVSVKTYSKKVGEAKYIITFSDITDIEYLNNNLENMVNEKTKELQILNNTLEERIKAEVEKNREKDKKIFEQDKLASMAEMIGDIAHHWRQPLSVITTASSGLSVKHELGMLDDNSLIENLDLITKSSEDLSKTIDNFRDLVKGDMNKKLFNLSEQIEKALDISGAQTKEENIKVIKKLDDSILLNNTPNGLLQVLVNIFNNSIDILAKQTEPLGDKYIFVDVNKYINKVVIKVKDNAGGIEPEMLNKVFHAYTTTKHKSKNVGLGLHSCHNIITQNMNGDIEVDNEDYEYDGKKYIGAIFTITLKCE
jgi:signal transduction histidine kinase/PAS domain-containing protein